MYTSHLVKSERIPEDHFSILDKKKTVKYPFKYNKSALACL